ncbi:hypothetical protein A3H53_04230 [Candidatus Nomurabacteria bacterium RIFCSPLOWO2_02_FULL_40_10]|uniref:Uncharacterized protein n=1 Tax=Candidatus Nomurabacteria bacterium RIFCSPLOWO2_02_FULL_40_10 TaxID=1801786 RepID=A0A1F6XWJ2_9BACT|nr:MAG: hypothetical protein A3H53_04230 [Candidatus Nomurabacteria bacterium RIFCSPLOWO2_02_FULL_40_10]
MGIIVTFLLLIKKKGIKKIQDTWRVLNFLDGGSGPPACPPHLMVRRVFFRVWVLLDLHPKKTMPLCPVF